MGPQVLLPPGQGLILDDVRLSDGVVHLEVCSAAKSTACPTCGQPSKRGHSGYTRRLADVPMRPAM
jgi:hypothetical protein